MANISVPKNIDAAAVEAKTRVFFLDASTWLRTHWLEILIAFAIGAALVAGLHALRRLAGRLAARDPQGLSGWVSIIGRALVKAFGQLAEFGGRQGRALFGQARLLG